MTKLYYSPPSDLRYLTCIDACLGRNCSSPPPLRQKAQGSARTNKSSQDVGKTSGEWQVRRRGRATRPGELFPPGGEGCLYLLLPELAHQGPLGFGRPQLCLAVHLLYLSHPLRISLWAILSTLMNVLAVSEHGAVSACPEQWSCSPSLRLNGIYSHRPFRHVFFGWHTLHFRP